MPDQGNTRNSTTPFTTNFLVCPSCGSEYTHTAGVKVVHRAEDGPASAIVARGTAVRLIVDQPIDSPSPVSSVRRGWIEVHGWCEQCEDGWMLVLQQHKGQTVVSIHVADLTR